LRMAIMVSPMVRALSRTSGVISDIVNPPSSALT
jgi:hypothetical protein